MRLWGRRDELLELDELTRREIVSHALSCVPEEACGVISRRRRSLCFWPAENAAQDPLTGFLITGAEQMKLLAAIWGRGEELAALVHSHPPGDHPLKGRTEPSPRDLEFAREIGRLTWVIVGLAGDEPQVGVHLLP